MSTRILIVVAGVTLAWAAPAMADPRLDEIVYSPYIENHTFELETRLGQEVGSGTLANAQTIIVEAEYGLNDRVSAALVTHIQRTPGESERLTGVGVETIVYLGQIPKIGVDAGLYLEGTAGSGGQSSGGEAKLLLAKTVDRFQGLLNLIVERPFAAPPGQNFASYGYAASATWQIVGTLRLGVEAFGDLGDDHAFLKGPQGAYVGPQVKWEGRPGSSSVSIVVDAGWLAPVGPSRSEAKSQARINLEFERSF